MSQTGIITDSTALFPTPSFAGHEHVQVLPMQLSINGRVYQEGEGIEISHLPVSILSGSTPKFAPPPIEALQLTLDKMGKEHREIVILLLSRHLHPLVKQFYEAIDATHTSAMIQVLDSRTTAVGLGYLVQAAAGACQLGHSALDVTRLMRGLIPRVYMILCLSSLSYLRHAGHLDQAQALVGELLGIRPIFVLDNGQFSPVQKVGSTRNLIDTFHQFITEIGSLRHIALLRGAPGFKKESRFLRERIRMDFPTVPYTEHTLGPVLGTILGPRTLGLVAVEDQSKI